MLPLVYYGTLSEANDYFANRLHSDAWTRAASDRQGKALAAASQIIDTLNYKGRKHPVWLLLAQYAPHRMKPAHFDDLIHQAELQQAQEFPRDEDTTVPMEVRIACYEIAYSLLLGRDPEKELETLPVTHHGFGPVRTSYDRVYSPLEHLINGVPSNVAWRLLRPFLRDANQVRLTRIS